MKKNILIIIFVITTIVASGTAVYFEIKGREKVETLEEEVSKIKNSENSINKNEESINKTENANNCDTNAKLQDSVPVEDLYGFDSQSKLAVKIVNNDLYYFLGQNPYTEGGYLASNEQNYIKLDSDVKRIKTVSLGTDTAISFLVIKNDGSVYDLHVGYDVGNDGTLQNMRAIYNLFEQLSNIDDILTIKSVSGSSAGIVADVKLLDGTNKTINTVRNYQ